MGETSERPMERSAGTSVVRELRWGLIGGAVGSVAGVGCALVAVLLDGASFHESGPYPAVFCEPRLLAIDVYLLTMLFVGLCFSVTALVQARRGPFPRSDGYGAGLLGTILEVLAGAILFVRVLALTSG